MKLHLGCGTKVLEGWENYDKFQIIDGVKAVDLDTPWPWDDNSADEIYMNHIVEHLSDMQHVFSEVHRVLKPDAVIRFSVPHAQGWGAYYPCHKLFFNWWTINGLCAPEWEVWKFDLVEYKVHFLPPYKVPVLDWLGSKFPRFCDQFFWVKPNMIDVILRKRTTTTAHSVRLIKD